MSDDCKERLREQVRHIVHVLENPPVVNDDGEELDYLDNYIQTEDGEWVRDFEHKGIDPLTDPRIILNNIDSRVTFLPDPEGDELTFDLGVDAWWSEDGTALILGGEVDEDVRPQTGYDFLTDVLDIEYIVNAQGEYIGARVLVAYGGPSIWINTRNNCVEGHWWGDNFTVSFEDSTGLDDALRELWESR